MIILKDYLGGKMSRHALVFLGFFLFTVFGLACESREMLNKFFHSKEDVNILLEKELSQGLLPDDVIAILERYQLEHSKYYPAEHPQIRAIARDVGRNGLVTESIQIKLFFNPEDKFESYELESIFTGP